MNENWLFFEARVFITGNGGGGFEIIIAIYTSYIICRTFWGRILYYDANHLHNECFVSLTLLLASLFLNPAIRE
jgi:hypothetical protein